MTNTTLNVLSQPDETGTDVLTALLRNGARQLIAQAVEVELQQLLQAHEELRLPDGRKAVVRNGYLPERSIQTGIGDVDIKVPKVRDRSGSGIRFTSALLPPYLKRARSVEELLPWLYLKGISTGDYQEALAALLGENAKGLSANTIFPAEHWVSIRTTNPIESAFATVRLRTSKTRNCGSRNTTLAMVYKLLQSAQKRWNRLKGFQLLTLVVNNVKFQDGEQVMEQSDRKTA